MERELFVQQRPADQLIQCIVAPHILAHFDQFASDVKEGRRVQLSLRVPDRPGMLAALLQNVAAERANVLEVHHNRAFMTGPIGDTEIELTLETKGPEHVETLVAALAAKGYAVVRR